jgi:hypothetical protein
LRCFAATINQLKGKVTMMFITHAMPKNLLVDEIVRIGQGSLSAECGGDTTRDTETGGGAMKRLLWIVLGLMAWTAALVERKKIAVRPCGKHESLEF